MADKITTLNIRMTEQEKNSIKEKADNIGKNISSYCRDILLSDIDENNTKNNTSVIHEKEERITDLKNQIDDYKNQIEQLHTIILVTQQDNQLLIEQKKKKWWKFWD